MYGRESDTRSSPQMSTSMRKGRRPSPATRSSKPSKGRVRAPMAISDISSYGSARMTQKGRVARVSHTEMFATALDGFTNNFTTRYLDVNPGNSLLFPWLSIVAAAYEKYCFRSIDICYVPACSATTIGIQGVYYDSDSTDEMVATLSDATDQRNSVQGPAWSPFKLHLDGVTLRGPLLERYIVLGVDMESSRDNNAGQIVIFAANGATGVYPGRFMVHYEVDLIEPQIDRRAVDYSVSTKIISASSDKAHPFTGAKVTGGSGVTVDGSGNTMFFRKPGWYEIDMEVTGGTTTVTPPTVWTSAGCSAAKWLTTHLINAAGTLQRVTFSLFALGDAYSIWDFTGAMASISSLVCRVTNWSRLAMDEV